MQLLIDVALSLVYFGAFLLICAWSWRFWKLYINQKHLNNIDWMMLEIKLPREILKSPYATEVAIASLLQGGGIGTWHHRQIKGSLPIFASLEIASIEGIVHFYVRAQRRFKSLIESNFYAQYPGIEIVEAEDYTSMIKYDHLTKDVGIWGATFRLVETWVPWDEKTGEKMKKGGTDYKMRADFLPLKTYVDYGLDKNPDEEYIIDPLAPLIEMMGSIGKGEHFWYQVILQDEAVYDNKKFPKWYVNEVTHDHMSLADMAEAYKKTVRIGGFTKKGEGIAEKLDFDEKGLPYMKKILNEEPLPKAKKEMELTMEEKAKLEAVNKKFSKPLAVSVVRLMYLSDNTKAKFNAQHVFNIVSFPKPFAGANRLFPAVTTQPYDYPWQNYRGRREPWRAEELFESFVEREGFYPHVDDDNNWLQQMEDGFFWGSTMKTRKTWRMLYTALLHPFHHPHPGDAITLNLEEIASLWHLPSAAITTPTLPRIDSAKAVAPVNLPQ